MFYSYAICFLNMVSVLQSGIQAFHIQNHDIRLDVFRDMLLLHQDVVVISSWPGNESV